MITLNSLSKIYRTDEIETVALENVNLTVERGEFLSDLVDDRRIYTALLFCFGNISFTDY